MTDTEMLGKITDYFGRGKDYSNALLDQLSAVIRNIPQGDRARVLEHLYDQYEATRVLSVKCLSETCRAFGISYRPSTYQGEKQRIECAACGYSYTWTRYASDADRLAYDVHSTCPRCGYAYAEELQYQEYARHGLPEFSKLRETRSEWMKKCRDNHAPGKEPAWSRNKALEDIKAEEAETARRRVEELRFDAQYRLAK